MPGVFVEVGWQRLVEDEQVDLVDAELAGALVEPVQGLVVAVVADPDLGFQEDLGAVDAGLGDGFADLSFVAVGGGEDLDDRLMQQSRGGSSVQRCQAIGIPWRGAPPHRSRESR
jgi:hypothetical protein